MPKNRMHQTPFRVTLHVRTSNESRITHHVASYFLQKSDKFRFKFMSFALCQTKGNAINIDIQSLVSISHDHIALRLGNVPKIKETMINKNL